MVSIQSEQDVVEAIKAAQGPLWVRGGGTHAISGEGSVLDLSGLSGVVLYEPGALTLVARAGTVLGAVEGVLAAEGQRLAFEPPRFNRLLGTCGESTIGGVVASNSSGSRRIQAGACRDSLLGVRYVDGVGTVVRNGGRVMKNVTGYDLVKLMAGSWGTLGVLTEVSLKVLPTPETEATLRVLVPDAAAAVKVLSSGLGSPFEVSGAAYDPVAGVALARVEGFASQVAYRVQKLTEVFAGAGEVSRLAAQESAALWRDIRDVACFAGRPGDVWRVSVKPTDGPQIAARAEADGMLMDWGGGLLWFLVPEGTDLRARLGVFAGHATLVRGTDQVRAQLGMFQPDPAPIAALSRGLQMRHDPRGLFNPGLMG